MSPSLVQGLESLNYWSTNHRNAPCSPPDDCSWLADCLNQPEVNQRDSYDDSHWPAIPIGWPIRNWLFGIWAHKWRTPKAKKSSWFRNSPLKEPHPLPLHSPFWYCLIAVKTPPVNYFHPNSRCLLKIIDEKYLSNCGNKRLLLFITNAFSSFFFICSAIFLLSNPNSNLHRLDHIHLLFPRILKQRGRGKKQRKTSRHMW